MYRPELLPTDAVIVDEILAPKHSFAHVGGGNPWGKRKTKPPIKRDPKRRQIKAARKQNRRK